MPEKTVPEQTRAIVIVNWNRCVERAAQIAEKAWEDLYGEDARKLYREHGEYIAGKIRKGLEADSNTPFLEDC